MKRCLLFAVTSFGLFALPIGAESAGSYMTGYNGGFFIQSPSKDFQFKIGARNKTLIAYENSGQINTATISLQETRLKLSGNLFGKSINFAIEHDLATNSVKDFFFDSDIGFEWGRFRVGKYKAQFSRQAIISSGKLNFANASTAVSAFSAGRIIGAMLHNQVGKPIEWSAGIIQDGFFGRLGYADEKMDAYNETDFEGGDFRVAAAANGYVKTRFKDFELLGYAGGVDAIFKAYGSATLVEFFVGRPALQTELLENPNFTSDKVDYGFYLQTGYLIHGAFEPCLRYSMLSKINAPAVNHELIAGVNFFSYENKVKVQLEGGILMGGSTIRQGFANLLFQFEL